LTPAPTIRSQLRADVDDDLPDRCAACACTTSEFQQELASFGELFSVGKTRRWRAGHGDPGA
jgi:hypothetical protein